MQQCSEGCHGHLRALGWNISAAALVGYLKDGSHGGAIDDGGCEGQDFPALGLVSGDAVTESWCRVSFAEQVSQWLEVVPEIGTLEQTVLEGWFLSAGTQLRRVLCFLSVGPYPEHEAD